MLISRVFRKLEDVDEPAFAYLRGFVLHSIMTGASIAEEAVKFGTDVAAEIIDDVQDIIRRHLTAMDSEKLSFNTADNILKNI